MGRAHTGPKIAIELDNQKKSTLSLRLTLEKCREGMPAPWPFRGTVVAMLERTEAITIKESFSNAPKLSLGTLGYLPAEIRLIVWEYVFMPFDGFKYISETTVPAGYYSRAHCYRMLKSDDCIPYGPQDYTNTVVNLLALPHKKFEIQHIYLSTRTFYFPQPQNLASYLEILQQRASSLRRVTILLSRHLKDDQAWIDAFANLPPNLISVAFKLQVLDEMSNRVNVFKKRLTTLDILNK